MAAAKAKRNADPVLDAAVEYFAARSHNAWRRTLLRTNPEQTGKPRMRLRGGVMVDVNQPWEKLHPKAQAENKRAARDAYLAVKKFTNDREAAADAVHRAWIRRNKSDPNQPKALFKPYARLSEVEKDKDRAHVDRMKAALAEVRRSKTGRAAKKATRKPARTVSVRIDAKAWKQLQLAARRLSKTLGREVTAETLAAAGADLIVSLSKAIAAKPSSKRA